MQKFTKENLFVLIAGTYLFDPTFSGLMNGQDTAIVLLGAALFAVGFFSGRYTLAGIGLSLTTLRPQIALFLAIPFFFHHRKVFWGFVIGSFVLVAISIGLLRFEGAFRFLEAIQYIESTIWHEAHAWDMPTIAGIIRRNFTIVNLEPVKNLVWLAYILGIAGFSFLWYRSAEIDERHIGLLFICAIFLVPYAHYHDLTILLIPIFCTLRIFQRESMLHQDNVAIVPLALSWLLTLGFAGSGSLKFPVVYAVMLLLVYFLTTVDGRRWRLFPRVSS